MIIYELAILGGILVFGIVALAACGRPLAEAYSEKVKARYAEVSPEKFEALSEKTARLEAEIIDLRQTVKSLEEALEFERGLESGKGQTLKFKIKE